MAQFREGRDITKVTRAALRSGLDLLGAREACVATLAPGKEQVDIVFAVPQASAWDQAFLTRFIRGSEEPIPEHLALGRLRRRQRMWGVLALRAPGTNFNWARREALSAIAAAANEVLTRIDEERIREVRARIDYKILEQLRPKDLFYQILHGLHSLTHYDHSATLLICRPDAVLEVVAETITWKKGKSEKIGLKLPLPDSLLSLLRQGVVFGFDRPAQTWEEWTPSQTVALAGLLGAQRSGAEDGVPLSRSMLCAPLVTRERVVGLLKIAARHSGFFRPYEAELVRQFLPHASIALQNSQRTASLEENLVQAERKHAMADLARGVAHDVNNALGAVLPLVQQMRADVASGNINPTLFGEDLSQIERSILTSRRIFSGMLSFARGTVRDSTGASIRQAVDTTRSILKEGLRRRGIELVIEVEAELPSIPGAQSDLEQLLLNLLSNARDAMPQGGRLRIGARRLERAVEIDVEDTGLGIAADDLPKVFEPFFTTKPDGNGLGLAICRSIVWQMQGKLDISSTPGTGTKVTARIPMPSQGAS
jgi:signal transduction histidine kinase